MVFHRKTRSASPLNLRSAGDVDFSASDNKLRTRDLALKAVSAFVLGLTALLFDVDVPSFVILYALYVGFAMFVTAPMMFVTDVRAASGVHIAQQLFVSSTAMLCLWAVAVLLPLWAVWSGKGQTGEIRLLDIAWSAIALPAFASMSIAWIAGMSYMRKSACDRAAIGFARPVFERALCVVAFVVFGPVIFEAVVGLGEVFPPLPRTATAMVIAFAVCEAYPVAANLVDRTLSACIRQDQR